MAREKETKSLSKDKEGNEIALNLEPSKSSELGRVYSNFVQISHSPWDFTLRFCDAPPAIDLPKVSKDSKAVTLEIPTKVELIIPVNVIQDLISALKDNYKNYVKYYGHRDD